MKNSETCLEDIFSFFAGWAQGFRATSVQLTPLKFRVTFVTKKHTAFGGLPLTLRTKQSLLFLGVVLGLAVTFAQETSNQDSATQEGAPSEFAAVRLAHVSSDAPLMDLLVDGRLRLEDIGFTELSEYIIVPAGEHELRVQPHRAPSDPSSSNPAIQAPEPFIISETLQAGRYYTLVTSGFFDPPPTAEALGVLSLNITEGTTATISGPRAYAATVTESTDLPELIPGTYTVTASREGFKTTRYEAEVRSNETTLLSIALQANDEGEVSELPEGVVGSPNNDGSSEWRRVQLQLYEDKLNSFPPPGSALIRVIHASPVTPAVSVVLERPKDNQASDRANTNQESNTQAPTELSSEPAVANLSYPNAVDYFSVSAGRVTFRLQDAESGQTITELASLELNAGTIYTFFVVGTRDDDFVAVIPSVDAILAGNP